MAAIPLRVHGPTQKPNGRLHRAIRRVSSAEREAKQQWQPGTDRAHGRKCSRFRCYSVARHPAGMARIAAAV